MYPDLGILPNRIWIRGKKINPDPDKRTEFKARFFLNFSVLNPPRFDPNVWSVWHRDTNDR